jgi:hypothetical protein
MNVQWQRCYGGNNHDAISGILELDDGYVFSGSTESTNMPGHKGDMDVWVVRIDFDGNIIWQKAFGGSRGEAGDNIFKTDDGGFIVAGNTNSNNGDVSGNHSIVSIIPISGCLRLTVMENCNGSSVLEAQEEKKFIRVW